MTDPTADSTALNPDSPRTTGPQPTVTTSGPDNTPTDTYIVTPSQDPGPDPAASAPYAIDEATLKAAKGDTHIWSTELADMIGHTTGTWIAPDTFVAWFATYADQIERAQARTIVFDIANTPIGEAIDGDAGTLLLDLRNDLAFKVRKRVGLL